MNDSRDYFVTVCRLLVTGCVFYLVWYSFTNEEVPNEMRYALLTLLGSAVAFWLGTSQSSAEKTKVIQGELKEDAVAPASPARVIDTRANNG